ncbi:hypothetical protein EGW37_09155, partial [Enterococcus faecium]
SLQEFCSKIVHREVLFSVNGCGNFILQKGLPFFYLHKIFYTLFLNFKFLYFKISICSSSVLNGLSDILVTSTKKSPAIIGAARHGSNLPDSFIN